MGCCLSTKKASSSAAGEKNQQHSSDKGGSDCYNNNGRGCVPPSMEEETVKEVLSETPTSYIFKPKPKTAIAKLEEVEKTATAMATPPSKLALQKIEEEVVMMKIEKKEPPVCEEISETVSDICSLSESVSTTTVTERRDDDDGEVKQRVDRSPSNFPRNRSYPGDLTGRRERVVGRSPARRSEPSPGRRNDGGFRPGLGRDGSQTTAARRRLATNVHRRDTGESSGRRSRSPVTRTEAGGTGRPVMGRSPSKRKTGQSPGRTRASPLERNPKVEESNKWPQSNESIENPLVSLECFIFL